MKRPDLLVLIAVWMLLSALGILIGIRVVNLIPEREFRYFIIIMTFLASLRLVL